MGVGEEEGKEKFVILNRMIQVDTHSPPPALLETRFEQDLKELRGISKKQPECFQK